MLTKLNKEQAKEATLSGTRIIVQNGNDIHSRTSYALLQFTESKHIYTVITTQGKNYIPIGYFFSETCEFKPVQLWSNRACNTWPAYLRLITRYLSNLNDIPDNIIVYKEIAQEDLRSFIASLSDLIVTQCAYSNISALTYHCPGTEYYQEVQIHYKSGNLVSTYINVCMDSNIAALKDICKGLVL